MIPGIFMALACIRTFPWPAATVMASYIVTCIFSACYHFNCAVTGNQNSKYLRLDLIGQQIGIATNAYHSVLGLGVGGGITPIAMLLPGIVMCGITDLTKETERNIAFAASATNILIASCFSTSLICQWLLAFCFFGIGFIPEYETLGHTGWHFMCHSTIYQYWQRLPSNRNMV
jgi:hypothetical protein